MIHVLYASVKAQANEAGDMEDKISGSAHFTPFFFFFYVSY
jgi:hypothetical protein